MKLVYKFLLPIIMILIGGFYFLLDKTVVSSNAIVDFLQQNSKELLLNQLLVREKLQLGMQNRFLKFSTKSISTLSSNFVVNYDDEGLSNELKSYFDIKAIKTIAVYDNMSNSYFIIVSKVKDKFVSKQILPSIVKKYKFIKQDMVFKNKSIGFVTVYFDDSAILKDIEKTKKIVMDELKTFTIEAEHHRERFITQIILTVLIILFIIIISVLVLSYKFVLAPLKIVKIGLDDFFLFLQNKKDNTKKINLNSKDEFGQMANSLNDNIVVSAKLHEEIHELNMNLEQKIEEKTAKVTTLLDNAGQGFLIFDNNFIIDDEYSQECIRLLGDNISHKNIVEILFKDTKKREFFKNTLISAKNEKDLVVQKSYISLLPSMIILNKRAIKLEYKLLQNTNLMLILTNITSQKKLEKKIKKEQEILKMIVAIVSESDIFYDTKKDFEKFINSYKSLIEPDKTALHNISSMYRVIHTFKGAFSQFYMTHIIELLHKVESEISNMLKENISSNNTLLTILNSYDFNKYLQKDLDITNNILGDEFLNSQNIIKINFNDIENLQKKITKILDKNFSSSPECQDILCHVRNLSSKKLISLLKPYIGLTKQLAIRLEKDIYEFHIIGDENIVVEDRFKPFIKSLIHLFRNSVDHGIETPEQRIEIGKDETGTIACSFNQTNNSLQIIISDDGAGIDIDKIKKRLSQQHINFDGLSKENIYNFIFNDNFTTKDKVSDISGRGVGMSAVKVELDKLNGVVEIKSNLNTGTTFVFNIPLK